MLEKTELTEVEPQKIQIKTPSLVARATSAHSAMGIAIAVVLYLICLSGTISVFKDKISIWEQGNLPSVLGITPKAVQRAAEQGFAKEPTSEHLYLLMPTDNADRLIVHMDNTEFYADIEGNIIGKVDHPWVDMIIDLHYYLHLPKTFGMIIVSIFGVFLSAMSFSGFYAHPNIFKDAFAFRRHKSKQIKQVDLHNRLSVWTAPFHLSNSITGAMIGLATLTAVMVGTLRFDGDFAAPFASVYGSEPVVNSEKDEMANLEKALTYMKENHENREPMMLVLHDPKTKGQYIQVFGEHARRLIYAEKYNFNGAGDFLNTTGSADGTIGQQAADSVYKVHFGNFGGLPVKFAFVIFGICLLFIIYAGMNIYFIKRHAKGRAIPKLEAAWKGVLWGVPMVLSLTLLLSIVMPSLNEQLSAIFWYGVVAIMILTVIFHKFPVMSKMINSVTLMALIASLIIQG